MVEVRVVDTPGLEDRSYVVTDGDVAVVIDPQRDIDRILDAVDDLPVTHVFETSLMDCVGREVVHIDDDWENAATAGNEIERG